MRIALVFFAALILGLAPPPSPARAAGSDRDTALNENFYGAYIVEEQAWIVGYYGAILHTPDRGQTWQIQRSPTPSALFSVRFVNSENGWIAGSYGTILHTADGGKNWRAQPAGTTEHLFGLAMIDASHGWIVGSRGTTLRTEDGGQSWASSIVPGDFTFSGVSFIDRARGWIAGEFGVIFHTFDGGKSWLKQKSPVEVSFASGESRNLFSLNINRADSGYAVGLDGVVLQNSAAKGWEIVRQGSVANKLTEQNHLFASTMNHNEVWAVGERGTLLQSNGDGKHWHQVKAEIPRVSLNGIAFGKNGFGLVVGNRGVVLRTEDGGVTWKRIKIVSQAPAKDLVRVP